VGQHKSTEEGRCVVTGPHTTLEGTVVFFLVRSGTTIRQHFLWGPFPGYIARAVQKAARRPTWGSNPGLIDRLIVRRNVTLTLAASLQSWSLRMNGK
jgi:NADH:ubiquinone oxidoreductase subunit D